MSSPPLQAPLHRSPLGVAEAAALMKQGGVVGVPTETVYGLAGLASNDAAVARIFGAKERPAFDPLIAHVRDASMAQTLVEWNAAAEKLATHFWPGALTLILPQRSPRRVSQLATSGLSSLGVRAPAHPVAQELLLELGESFVAPSANPFGKISPTSRAHVEHGLGKRIDGCIEGGECIVGVESTIISLLGKPTLLRFGGVSQEAIEAVLQQPLQVMTASREKNPEAPGLLPSHYAPRQPLTLKERHEPWPNRGEAQLAFSDWGDSIPERAASRKRLSPDGNLQEAAAQLFAALHALEASDCTSICAEFAPEEGLGRAINDRLRRAAGLG